MFSDLDYSFVPGVRHHKNVNSQHSPAPSINKIILWNTLAFQAGSLNVGGFLACHKFVSHVTGFSTLFGASLAQNQLGEALGFLTVPLFFLLGSMISGFFIDSELQKNRAPRFDYVFSLLTLFTALILALGASHVFGKFGMSVEMEKDYYLLALLCLTCGLQNATVTSAYGAVVRTTHLTGLTTDLGVGLVRIFKVGPQRQELNAILMRVGIILSFTMGSLVCGLVFVRFAYWGFVIPFLISIGLLILSLAFKKRIL